MYPPTARGDVVDVYHGTPIPDPYRWLEDLDSPETAAWVKQQNELTTTHLEGIPFRNALRARLTELWEYEEVGLPTRVGTRLLYLRRLPGQDQQVLVTLVDGAREPTVVLDPNTMSEDGTVALTGASPTTDGSLLAFGTSEAGSDRQVWRVLDIATGDVRDDELTDVKFSLPSWLPDNSGFLYGHYPSGTDEFAAPNLGQRLMLHRLGTPQAEDVVVIDDPEHPDRMYGTWITQDGRYAVIQVARGTDDVHEIRLLRLDDPDAEPVPLFTGFDAAYSFVRSDADVLTFVTTKDAPMSRLVAVDVADPRPEAWRELIPTSGLPLLGVTSAGGRYFAHYLRDAASETRVFDLDGGAAGDLATPGLGTVVGLDGRDDHAETYYLFDSYGSPPVVYRYDIERGVGTEFARPHAPLDPDAFITERVFVTSGDGTRFPMFLTRRADVTPDERTPTVLYGYGGFNNPMVPGFSKSFVPLLEAGGTYAVACIRGGGEYGKEWHQAGTKQHKQNVFDDFIAAAEHLIEQGMTSREHLAIMGGSNGGLLVGACITQRPELFAAANTAVGVLDMLRYHRFTIGWAWADDYGTADDPEMFETLLAYSPLHNVRPETYPAVIITTGDHDDRVVPGHSYKFAAALQAAQSGPAPVLLRVDVRAGHGVGKPATKLIEAATDVQAFLMDAIGLDDAAATSAR